MPTATRLTRDTQRRKRHARVRRKVTGTAERPRLVVYKSLKHIYAQVVDDKRGHTMASASTLAEEARDQATGATVEAARLVGRLVAQRARAAGVEEVVFDRGGYPYHGKVKALADAVREEGLIL
ncbi:MAG: 50S ribosomal protein L18 [Candidatus Bipolaricaulota bacterium]